MDCSQTHELSCGNPPQGHCLGTTKKAQDISVFFFNKKKVEHFLNVCGYGNRVFPEPKRDSQKAIVEVRSL